MKKKFNIEIIVKNYQEILLAQELLIDRIELIKDLENGGLIPPLSVIKKIPKTVKIPIFVMLRTKTNSFVYYEKEFKYLLKLLKQLKQMKNITGIVFGSLNSNLTINEEQLNLIIANKGNLKLTYHRAVDVTRDYKEAILTLKKYQNEIDFLLTSGHEVTAIKGIKNLKLAISVFKEKIIIGSGLTLENVPIFLNLPCVKTLHFGTTIRNNHDFNKEINLKELKKLIVVSKQKKGNN